jgi:hypothetical protein
MLFQFFKKLTRTMKREANQIRHKTKKTKAKTANHLYFAMQSSFMAHGHLCDDCWASAILGEVCA